MHSLVHLAIWSWVADNDWDRMQSQAVIARLREVFPTDDWENRHIWRQYLPHAIKLLRCDDNEWSEELCGLGYWVGRCLAVDGRVKEAVELLQHVVRIKEIILIESHPDRLASQHELAGAYQANGQITEAVELLEYVVVRIREIIVPSHPSRLVSEQNL